jgi:hypothetical protein
LRPFFSVVYVLDARADLSIPIPEENAGQVGNLSYQLAGLTRRQTCALLKRMLVSVRKDTAEAGTWNLGLRTEKGETRR